eukprot:scaffold12636_cov176-Amphora_coffeaeformis.AAC.9
MFESGRSIRSSSTIPASDMGENPKSSVEGTESCETLFGTTMGRPWADVCDLLEVMGTVRKRW